MFKVIHHPDYDATSVDDAHRFPMRKYLETAALLREAGLITDDPAHVPEPASFELISAAHDPVYVDAIFNQTVDRKTAREIGFEVTPDVAMRSRLSCMGTLMAARAALRDGLACNAAGGSHHAKSSHGAGFCVFNDVAVAIRGLQSEGAIGRALIVDCDVHQGDGTAEIFQDDDRVFTFSLHCEDNWPTRKVASDLDIGLDAGEGDGVYLRHLRRGLNEAFEAFSPDIVFYNAGVDPHADDRLGKLKLTDDGIRQRDRAVIRFVRELGLPFVGVMGGGYSRDVPHLARLHAMMFEEAARAQTLA